MGCAALLNENMTYVVFSLPILPLHDKIKWMCLGCSMEVLFLARLCPLVCVVGVDLVRSFLSLLAPPHLLLLRQFFTFGYLLCMFDAHNNNS